ncbi:MAG: ribokinase, partial [Pirellulales bacterium]|nr:ribokinase [Pirellulales bacterium]
VTLVAKVGNDSFGQESIERFIQEGIRTDFIHRDETSATGTALILVDGNGQNAISVAPGANFNLTPDEVETALRQIGSFDALLLQLEIPLLSVHRAAAIGAEVGARVILDPAPAVPLDHGLLTQIDWLTPNQTEAEILTGIEVLDRITARVAAERLLAEGTRMAVLTLGSNGALLHDGLRAELVPAPSVDACDVTAGGDAFNAALACALAEGKSPSDAVGMACIAGALAVTKPGAQPSLPTAEDIKQFVAG